MTSKLYKGIKSSVEEIIQDYKQKRAESEAKENESEEVNKAEKKAKENASGKTAAKP